MKLCSDKVTSLHDIMFAVRKGVLICDLVSVIFNTKLVGVVR